MSTSYTVVATFPSKSRAGKVYTVKQDPDGNLSCDCPVWVFNRQGDRTCYHTMKVLAQATESGMVKGVLVPIVVTTGDTLPVSGNLLRPLLVGEQGDAGGWWKDIPDWWKDTPEEASQSRPTSTVPPRKQVAKRPTSPISHIPNSKSGPMEEKPRKVRI